MSKMFSRDSIDETIQGLSSIARLLLGNKIEAKQNFVSAQISLKDLRNLNIDDFEKSAQHLEVIKLDIQDSFQDIGDLSFILDDSVDKDFLKHRENLDFALSCGVFVPEFVAMMYRNFITSRRKKGMEHFNNTEVFLALLTTQADLYQELTNKLIRKVNRYREDSYSVKRPDEE